MQNPVLLRTTIIAFTVLCTSFVIADQPPLQECADDLSPTSRAAPKWPRLDKMRSKEGQATFEFRVDTDGSVSDFVLVSAESTSESESYANAFARSARRALKKWTYAPVSQACLTTQTIEFRLN